MSFSTQSAIQCCVYFNESIRLKEYFQHYFDNENLVYDDFIKRKSKLIFEELKKYYSEPYLYKSSEYYNNSKSKNYSIFIFVGSDDGLRQIESRLNNFIDYYSMDYDYDINDLLLDSSRLYTKFFCNIKEKSPVNVAVFDFDDTLVTPDLKTFYKTIWCDLEYYRDIFHYVVLWTHGTEDYISKYLNDMHQITGVFKFDLIIARKRTVDFTENKGLSVVLKYLNREFGIERINFACLLDDKVSNFVGDYDVFVEAKNITSGYYLKKLEKLKLLLAKYNKYKKLELVERII